MTFVTCLKVSIITTGVPVAWLDLLCWNSCYYYLLFLFDTVAMSVACWDNPHWTDSPVHMISTNWCYHLICFGLLKYCSITYPVFPKTDQIVKQRTCLSCDTDRRVSSQQFSPTSPVCQYNIILTLVRMINDWNTYLLNYARMNWLVVFTRKIYQFSLPITSILIGDSCNFCGARQSENIRRICQLGKKTTDLAILWRVRNYLTSLQTQVSSYTFPNDLLLRSYRPLYLWRQNNYKWNCLMLIYCLVVRWVIQKIVAYVMFDSQHSIHAHKYIMQLFCVVTISLFPEPFCVLAI